jgi:hypothetical protein
MAVNAKLRPFRQYHENDVINLFAFDAFPTGLLKVDKGAMVIAKGADGWMADDEFNLESINNSYPNTVSDRWHVAATIERCNDGGLTAGSEERPMGMLLYDVTETDENGEKLLWHPRKYHEMQVALLGHAVPVLTRGIVLLNGIDETGGIAGPGVNVYAVGDGQLSTSADPNSDTSAAVKVGVCLGKKASNNDDVLVRFDVGL